MSRGAVLCSDGDSAREQRAARRARVHADRDRALLPRSPPQQASTRHVVVVAVDDHVGERLQSAADSARKRGRPVGDAHGCCCCQAAAEERSRLARR